MLNTTMHRVLMAVLLVLTCQNCSTASKKSDDNHNAQQAGSLDEHLKNAKVARPWQEKFLEQMKESKATEAWGLFSIGGFHGEGEGHRWFMLGEKQEAVFIAPGAKSITKTSALNAAQSKNLANTFKAFAHLKDRTTPLFDAVEYEYVHVVQTNGHISVSQRVFMRLFIDNTPNKANQPYADLLDTFFKLIPTP